MSLQEAVSAGVNKNPDYGAAAQDALAQREVFFQAKGLNLPSLDFQTETGPEYTDSLFVKNQQLWHSRANLTLSQLLYDGKGTKNQIRGEEFRMKSSVRRAAEAAENAGLDTVEAFLDVLRQREQLDIARINVNDHLKILDIIDAGAKAGTVTQGDLAQVKARLAQARATVATAEESLRKSESTFVQKTGDMPGTLSMPEAPAKYLPANVEDAVRLALTHNPTLAVADANVDASAADKEATTSLMYPRVNLVANAMVGDNLSGTPGNQKSRSLLAVAKWNLYHGGADKARYREALYREGAAKEKRLQALRGIEKDTRDTWAGMVSAADRTKEYGEQIDANEKVVSVYMDQFTISKRTLLDVLDAENELFFSRSNKLNAAYAEKFAGYRLLALQGRLLDTLGVPKPRETAMVQ